MSDFDANSQMAGDSGPKVQPTLTFFQRFLLATNLWTAYVIVAVDLTIRCFASDSLWQWMIGFALLLVTFFISRGLWRFLKRGRFRAGMAVVLFFMFNVASALLFCALFLWVVLQDEALVEQFTTKLRWNLFDPEVGLVEEESRLNFDIQSGSRMGGRRGFDACVEELHRGEVNQSMRTEAIKILGYTVGESLAEDAVQDVMVKVCLKFEDGKVQVLRPYFFQSINNARADLQKRKVRDRKRYCEFDARKHKGLRDSSITSEEQFQLVQAAMCRIDERQAQVIRLRMDGLSDQVIADRLHIRRDYVRKLHSLGVESLREEIKILSR